MLSFSLQHRFSVDPAQVFDALVDVDGFCAWAPGLDRVERLSPDQPVGEGSRFRMHRRLLGKQAKEVVELARLERPHALEVHVDGSEGAAGRGLFRFVYELSADDRGGTKLSLIGELSDLPRPMVILGPLVVRVFREAFARDFRALARHLDAPAAS